jgi:GntR family carbon starvation induced transcriptional regulator
LKLPNTVRSVATFTDAAVAPPAEIENSQSKVATYWLRRDIVRGAFEPAERLKVEQLVNYYGVGHSPVREAILLLSPSGLVVHEHQKGYRVAPVSLADYDDVVAVYQRLYKLALTMAMELGDEAWEERVVIQLHRLAKVPIPQPDGDPQEQERWQRAYWELHGQLVSGCGSPLMLQMIGDIGFRLERYVNLFADRQSVDDRSQHKELREIVDAVIARDKPRAIALIEAYFDSAQPVRNSIIEKLKAAESRPLRRRGRPPKG